MKGNTGSRNGWLLLSRKRCQGEFSGMNNSETANDGKKTRAVVLTKLGEDLNHVNAGMDRHEEINVQDMEVTE